MNRRRRLSCACVLLTAFAAGDEIERVVALRGSSALDTLAGRPMRLQFALEDADVYSLQFQRSKSFQ